MAIKINEDVIINQLIKKEYGWSDLAKISGVTRKTIWNLRYHPEKINFATISKIASALDLDVKDLII